ncbi:MAG: Ig-like domain-containing protein [Bacteroidales bacterium]|nr:Ig-like domain-containing protein [Bacteroidales bacterium]
MKKYTYHLLVVILVSAVIFNACHNDPDPPETETTIPAASVILNQTTTNLDAGGTLQLTATVLPEDATNRNVTWSSNDTSVVTVNSSGIVTGISVGNAIITVRTEDGNHTAMCAATVYPPILPNFCNLRTPGWGENLGTITFHSQGHNVVISGYGITQTWSGAVTATNCQKITFSGEVWNDMHVSFNADCRSNSNLPGDLFSWCAVVRFADDLCPYPWRVPTTDDFRDLDIALGGTGDNRDATLEFVNDNFIARWGGAFGGYSFPDGTSWNQATLRSIYWSSQSQFDIDFHWGNVLHLSMFGEVRPQGLWNKGSGVAVRCVQ